MKKAKVYNTQGKATGEVALPDTVFSVPWNDSLMHQVVISMQANARTPVAHVKERGEVRGGGRKPWRQKGTGRARHGSIRSPLWRGGGITFGPRNDRVWGKRINKKMRVKALYAALSRKFSEDRVLFIDALALPAPKTSDAKKVLSAVSKIRGFEGIATKRNNNVLIVLPEKNATAKKSFSNIGNVEVEEVRNVNPVDVLQYAHIVIIDPDISIAAFEERTKRAANISVKNKETARKSSARKTGVKKQVAKK